MSQKRLAVIPARGGSKRLPRKNIADFLGRPIIAYTIYAACESGLFQDVIVSTEDNEIASVASRFGARIAGRPSRLSDDAARVTDVCLDLLGQERAEGRTYDVLCCLYATAPLRTANDVRGVVELLEPNECLHALAATDYALPPHQALKLLDDNCVQPWLPELVNKRASDIGRLVVDNGSTYAVFTDEFLRVGSFYGPKMRAHLMPRMRSIDIDLPEDLELARHIASNPSKFLT